ncbi:hypothetical protein [Marinisporobacter balticus]|uniref:PASTA domain-containing protein n=1 Tax=Marinisporobacter balticus TaxID=2018667 RepID=A0A4R2KZ06_9FIRM|nr:hypothetical protein [Marinisporobacter balticus]TCO79911.1 hypothetical protein EV214_101145 [Marinisporobacter balticus]
MSEATDVVGLHLQKAVEILNAEFQISIKKTRAPKNDQNLEECRVIKQKNTDYNIELTVSYF